MININNYLLLKLNIYSYLKLSEINLININIYLVYFPDGNLRYKSNNICKHWWLVTWCGNIFQLYSKRKSNRHERYCLWHHIIKSMYTNNIIVVFSLIALKIIHCWRDVPNIINYISYLWKW